MPLATLPRVTIKPVVASQHALTCFNVWWIQEQWERLNNMFVRKGALPATTAVSWIQLGSIQVLWRRWECCSMYKMDNWKHAAKTNLCFCQGDTDSHWETHILIKGRKTLDQLFSIRVFSHGFNLKGICIRLRFHWLHSVADPFLSLVAH